MENCHIYSFGVKPENCTPWGWMCRCETGGDINIILKQIPLTNNNCCYTCHYYKRQCINCKWHQEQNLEIPIHLQYPKHYPTCQN